MTMSRLCGILNLYISKLPGVRQAAVHERTCNAVVNYTGNRDGIIDGIRAFGYDYAAMEKSTVETSGRSLNRL